MSINLLNAVQENLGYPVIKKVDPNTQEVEQKEITPNQECFAQAAIPAVLAGISNLAKSEEGSRQLAFEDTSDWLSLIFAKNKKEVVSNVSRYAMYEAGAGEQKMNEIAAESVRLIRTNSTPGDDLSEMKKFIGDQRNNIYPFILAELKIGSVLNDSTIDDRTHKMEGPISSLMHKIEHSFGGSETAEDADKKSAH